VVALRDQLDQYWRNALVAYKEVVERQAKEDR
jgi:hypothetical protein